MAVPPPKAQMPKWPCPNQAKMLKPLQFTPISHTLTMALNPRSHYLLKHFTKVTNLQYFSS